MGFRLFCTWALLVTFALPGAADTPRGEVRGIVRDHQRAPVAGAALVLVQQETNAQREATTGTAGDFVFASLAPGTYRLEVQQGQHKRHVEHFGLAVSQQRTMDVVLQLGALTETVEVTAPNVDLQRVSPAQTTVVDARLVTGLPLDGRNFLELALLVPGHLAGGAGLGRLGS